jgi:hypothetical protein
MRCMHAQALDADTPSSNVQNAIKNFGLPDPTMNILAGGLTCTAELSTWAGARFCHTKGSPVITSCAVLDCRRHRTGSATSSLCVRSCGKPRATPGRLQKSPAGCSVFRSRLRIKMAGLNCGPDRVRKHPKASVEPVALACTKRRPDGFHARASVHCLPVQREQF